MDNNYLITGYWGKPHVTVENDRGVNAAIFGAGRFVFPVGNQFRAEYIGDNTVRVYDGKLIDNGAIAGIPVGHYVDLLIPETAQGMKRTDTIVFQYSKDAATLIESGNFVVVKGEETSGTPTAPTLTEQDILSDTATFDQMPLWSVSVSSTIISEPVKLFTVCDNLNTIYTALTRAMEQVADAAAPVLHRSASETYGKGSSVYYGHVKLSDATDNTSGVSGGTAATPAAVKSAYDLAKAKAPTDHSSTADTYGLGTTAKYGHVKLTESFDADGADGLAASAKLTKQLYTYIMELIVELDGKAQSNHNQTASTITAGTLAGQVKANTTAVATVGTAQVRNISAGTSDKTAGSSGLTTGELYFVYE